MSIGFIGLGKLGLPCAAALSVHTKRVVYGTDLDERIRVYISNSKVPYIEEKANEYLKSAKLEFKDNISQVLEKSEIVFIAVQTPHDSRFEGITPVPEDVKDFDYEPLRTSISQIVESLQSLPNKKITLVLISTVLPGTVRSQVLPLLSPVIERIKFCYNPFFIAMGTTIKDFLNPEFILVGENHYGDSDYLVELYSGFINAPVQLMKIESAELTKVAYNTFIGFKIVFANTLSEIADSVGGNVDEVTSAISIASNRLISGKYLKAGMADGGGCHPRDQIAMSWLAKEANLSANIFDFLAKARDQQTLRQAELIEEKSKQTNLPVIVLGKSYKPNINLTVGSPALLLCSFLEKKSIKFSVYDPICDPNSKLQDSPAIFFVATNHDIFKVLEIPAGSVVIDPWGNTIHGLSSKVLLITPGRNS
jgi:UDPglucose 6-dehydrogenase